MRLQSDVVRVARDFDGELGLVVHDLASGLRYSTNAVTPSYLASVVKLPVMITVYRMIDTGELSRDELVEVGPDDLRDGGGELRRAGSAARYSIEELVALMMQLSDNGATDLVLARIGAARVNATLRSLGFADFGPITTMLDVRRRVFGGVDARAAALSPAHFVELWLSRSLSTKGARLAELIGAPSPFSARELERAFDDYYATAVNSAPLESVAALLEALLLGRLASLTSTHDMLRVMIGCETGAHRLRAHLPDEVPFAHKTGTQHRRACDAGVLFVRPSRPAVVVACAKGFVGLASAERVMARVGERVYAVLDAEARRVEDLAAR